MRALDPVLAPEALSQLSGPMCLFDARGGPGARGRYAERHLRGAVFADLEVDLADVPEDAAHGGRHPLPGTGKLADFLGRSGVTPAHHVVIYDDQGGANAAARLWWMLRAVGHRAVQVLDGGLEAALEAGLETTDATSAPTPAPPYPVWEYASPQARLEEVDALRSSRHGGVIDVRAAARFRGEVEPIDPVAGHIPGAINVPFSENLQEDGRFKSPAALRALYGPLLGATDPTSWVVHCGSGVTACHTLLALDRAGLRGAKLYVGSWSEWCRRPSLARVTGEA